MPRLKRNRMIHIPPSKMYSFAWCFVLLFLFTIVKIYYLYNLELNLFFDEAQYWDWSRELEFGYYSKPPMVAWLIALTSNFCGDSEFCIRLPSSLLHFLTSIVVYYTAKTLYDEKTAFYSAITYITLPAVTLSSILISTDPPLLFFWAVSMLCFLKATYKNNITWWLLAGIAGGLGMMSKYNMLFFLISAIVYILIVDKKQKFFNSAGFWLAIISAFIIFLPNIIWNYNNHFSSFLHTRDNANFDDASYSITNVLEFIGAQFGVFGPILFAYLLIILALSYKFFRREADRFLLSFILPMLIAIAFISFVSRAHANWAAPIYVPATILVTAFLIDNNKKLIYHSSLAIHVIAAIIAANFYTIVNLSGFSISGKTNSFAEKTIKDPLKRMRGWEKLGKEVEQLKSQYQDTKLLTITRKLHAELLYYANIDKKGIIKWNPNARITDHYDLTTNILSSTSEQYVLLTDIGLSNIGTYFSSHKKIADLKIPVYNDYTMNYEAYLLTGLKKERISEHKYHN